MNGTSLSDLPKEVRDHISRALGSHGMSEDDPLCSVILVMAYISEVIERRKRRTLLWLSALVCVLIAAGAYLYGHDGGWREAMQAYPHTLENSTDRLAHAVASLDLSLNRVDQTLMKAGGRRGR